MLKPFADEIIRVYLDSTSEDPHVERLVHHRSRSLGMGKSPICYWKILLQKSGKFLAMG